MAFDRTLLKEVQVYKLVREDSGNLKYKIQFNSRYFRCSIQAESLDEEDTGDDSVRSILNCYMKKTSETDLIGINDRLVEKGGDTYNIMGARQLDYGLSLKWRKFSLTKN